MSKPWGRFCEFCGLLRKAELYRPQPFKFIYRHKTTVLLHRIWRNNKGIYLAYFMATECQFVLQKWWILKKNSYFTSFKYLSKLPAKVQTNSKWFYSSRRFLQRTNEQIRLHYYFRSFLEESKVRFLEESEDTKKTFWN